MSKSILTIGFELASEEVESEDLESNASLLDWDIVLFKPTLSSFTPNQYDSYQGKTSLEDRASFALREASEHWRIEIMQAFDLGKTIVVFLSEIEEVFIATGRKEYSGTGRNQRVTRIVEPYTNYRMLPISFSLSNGNGSAIKLAAKGAEAIAPYWAEFSSVSQYNVLLPADLKGACLVTKHGDRPVGAIIRSKKSAGSLVLLPNIDFLPEHFFAESDGEPRWSDDALQFASRMIASVVELDKILHASTEITPEPAWAKDTQFALAKEQALRSELLQAEEFVEQAQKRKEDVQGRLATAGQLRGLLYEKGKPLERAIIEALKLLGFDAHPYKQGESEFDVVFESEEGRMLGEAEGKDNKAINIDKLRQLAMNIHEDLQRDEVTAPAKGVLFGNGYRLEQPANRKTQFTEKCISAAQSSSTALVQTTDLYRAAQYLSERADAAYAHACRQTILRGVGMVDLPAPPTVEKQVIVESSTTTQANA